MKRIKSIFSQLGAILCACIATFARALTPAHGSFGAGVQQMYPTVEDFRAAIANRPGDVEIVKWSLYDSAIYVAAGQTSLNFFQQPIGQGNSTQKGASAQAKSLGDTNMTQAGMLPNPQGFYIQSIELQFFPGSTHAGTTDWAPQIPVAFDTTAATTVTAGEQDVQAAYIGGALTFTIGQKPYLQEAPLLKFPPKTRFGLQVSGSIAGTNAQPGELLLSNMFADGRPYMFPSGIGLMSGQNFNVALSWPVAIALPSSNNGKFICVLDGYLLRGIQ